jgi:hypothetical protein
VSCYCAKRLRRGSDGEDEEAARRQRARTRAGFGSGSIPGQWTLDLLISLKSLLYSTECTEQLVRSYDLLTAAAFDTKGSKSSRSRSAAASNRDDSVRLLSQSLVSVTDRKSD